LASSEAKKASQLATLVYWAFLPLHTTMMLVHSEASVSTARSHAEALHENHPSTESATSSWHSTVHFLAIFWIPLLFVFSHSGVRVLRLQQTLLL
jgi:phosphatidylglycerophosphate synthase